MRVTDVEIAREISADAGRRFATVAEPRIAACADDPPFTVDELTAYVHSGHAWVATEDDDVVGFVVTELIDDVVHIEEIDVARRAGRQGHASRLLDTVTAWAEARGSRAVTLTTFDDVPWNRPWYERHGFRVLRDSELSPGLRAVRDRESALGLPADLRVVMRRDLGGALRDEPLPAERAWPGPPGSRRDAL